MGGNAPPTSPSICRHRAAYNAVTRSGGSGSAAKLTLIPLLFIERVRIAPPAPMIRVDCPTPAV